MTNVVFLILSALYCIVDGDNIFGIVFIFLSLVQFGLYKLSKTTNIEQSLQSLRKEEFQPYGQFLAEVLQAIHEKKDKQVVYRLLAANINKLDDNLAEVLRRWAVSIFDKVKAEEAESIGFAIGKFSILIRQFPLGNKANNVEIAITGYKIILTIFTKNTSPKIWATIQNNLGTAYTDRIEGEKAENIEKAIEAYNAALKVKTYKRFPQDWANIQCNLGVIYTERIKGDRAENIEKAIEAYNAALKVKTYKRFPQDWANIQCNLGVIYTERIKGDRAENIEKAIAACNASLEVYTRKNFPYESARTQQNLGNAYSIRIKGDKPDNIEKAIEAYNAALEVYNRDKFPYEWAKTQMNLGVAYSIRIKGDKPDNIENAIAACNASLEVCTRDDFPYEWASTQNNLGIAYLYRIKEDNAENIEKAIIACNASLEVCTHDDFPYEWAETQNNLGIAYLYRIKGDKAENIEKAIIACNASLEVYTRDKSPYKWANTQMNLGVAYCKRIKGDKADNIENAIAAYNASLEVYTRKNFPYESARTQNNLGNAYIERIRIKGDKPDNIEKAIEAYNAALEVYTRDKFPYEWARAQVNLGNAYSYRIKGDKPDNIEKAIAAHNAALEVYTRDKFPYEWANTQISLGSAYTERERVEGDKPENIEKAIAAHNAALEVCTRDDFPQNWAMTQMNLGNAYSYRIKGDKAENIEKAIAAYNAALEIYTPTAVPIECLRTANNLGNLLFKFEKWQQAINAYDKAIQAVELSRSWASDNTRRQEIIEDAINVYKNIVQACINNEQPEKAIEYAERSKARNLVELVHNSQLEPNIPQKQVIDEFKLLRKQIEDEQRFVSRQAKNTNKDEYQRQAENRQLEESRQRLEQLQQQLDELIKIKIQPYDPSFSLTQKIKPIQFKEIQSLLDKNTAIIEWYLTKDKITAFLITPKPPVLFFGRRGGNINVWESQPEELDTLAYWAIEYLGGYYTEQKETWQEELEKRLAKLAEILHIDELIAQIPKQCDKLILIPHRFLHIFPLHALEIQNQETSINQCLLELFPRGVSYAPSCQLLQLAQKQQRPDFQSLFAIQNPTQDLTFAELEVNCILSDFQQHQILSEQQATKDNLSQKNPQLGQVHYLHFSCHGSFQPNSPLDSFLLLAAAFISPIPPDTDNQRYLKISDDEAIDLNKCLTLSNLFEREIDLNQCRLVVLSACETGLIDFNNTSDEYIGLPSGFLYAGSASVVSSLWQVNDLSTAFLMIKFSQNLKAAINKGEEISVPVALNQAQLWLRNVTKEDLQQWTSQLSLDDTWQIEVSEQLDDMEAGSKPYQSPYYWAAFTAIGK